MSKTEIDEEKAFELFEKISKACENYTVGVVDCALMIILTEMTVTRAVDGDLVVEMKRMISKYIRAVEEASKLAEPDNDAALN